MRKLMLTAAASSLALMTGACAQEARQDAQNEAAEGLGMNTIMADPLKPFGEAEVQMNNRMLAAVGVNAADSWVRKIIEHHRGAVDMSRVVLDLDPSAHVAQMARETIDKQTRDIAELEKLAQQGQPDPQSAAIYRPAIEQMHGAVMAATGSDPSDAWLRKMAEHHRGGVALTDVLLQQQVVPAAIRRQAERTKSEQQRDLALIERMLRGKPMEAVAAQSARPAAEPRRETARTEPKASPKPSPEAAPKTAEPADPHAGHDMNNMQ